MNVAIVGANAYLAKNISRYFENLTYYNRLEYVPNPGVLKTYDYIVNFSLQPEFKTQILKPDDIIDVQIANIIKDSKCKLVMISSRKVYGSNARLAKYTEKSALNPVDVYAKNKVTAERCVLDILPDRCLILRLGNILDEPTDKKEYNTFIGWIAESLKSKGILDVTEHPDVKKDFITRDYFQYALHELIVKNCVGVYNIGAGYGISLKEFLPIITGKKHIVFNHGVKKRDQFILGCNKLHTIVKPFPRTDIDLVCQKIHKKLLNQNAERGNK